MTAVLGPNQYGKIRVNVMKVERGKDQDHVFEVGVDVLLQGAFEKTFLTGDNSQVVPTDTCKNTVYYLSKSHLGTGRPIESFGISICKHFLKEYKHVEQVNLELRQRRWVRMIDPKTGKPHNISFIKESSELRTANVSLGREKPLSIVSGIVDLVVLKTTGSGFVGFHKDKLTTLPEVSDRLMSTSAKIHWTYDAKSLQAGSIDFCKVHNGVRQQFFDVFANEYSKSVQQTVYRTGEEVIARFPEVQQITLRLPNIHFFHFNIDRFGLNNDNEVYYPTEDGAAGHLEATVVRAGTEKKAIRAKL